jgi:hypothetical protein
LLKYLKANSEDKATLIKETSTSNLWKGESVWNKMEIENMLEDFIMVIIKITDD